MRRTYYDDLGIPSSAGRKAIEMAYWRRQGKGPAAGRSAEACRRAEEAYLTLSDPEKRRSYDRLLGLGSHPAWTPSSSRRAGLCLQTAAAMAKRGRNRRALSLLRRAVAIDPGNAACRSLLGLLVARTGGSLREAAGHCRGAYERAPHKKEVVVNYAAICEMTGLRKRAAGLRQRAKGLS